MKTVSKSPPGGAPGPGACRGSRGESREATHTGVSQTRANINSEGLGLAAWCKDHMSLPVSPLVSTIEMML